jgi:hypothetical protein
MAMHTYKPPVAVRLPADSLARKIAQSQARRILALRLEHRMSRVVVVERTRINWKRIRSIEEGSTVACLDELVRLAWLFSMQPKKLIQEILSVKGAPRKQVRAQRSISRRVKD